VVTTEGRALARAALAGNPSDRFGGAVLATVVPGLETTVRVADADEVVVGTRTWPSLAEVGGPHHGDEALLGATVERLVRWCRAEGHGAPAGGVALGWTTTIPHSVGLAGSSALVIAGLRALAARWQLDLDVLTTARLALEVETDLLGLAAGPQDRLAQAAGSTVLMDFRGPGWRVEPVEPRAPASLFVAWDSRSAAPSDSVHRPLGDRAAEPEVRAAMARLADLARQGATALRTGDLDALGDALDASYETRASVIDLDPAHVALVEGARACGAPANYAGSGGAVVGLVTRPEVLGAVRAWAAAAGLGLADLAVPVRGGRGR
jgi:glucuronokinase